MVHAPALLPHFCMLTQFFCPLRVPAPARRVHIWRPAQEESDSEGADKSCSNKCLQAGGVTSQTLQEPGSATGRLWVTGDISQ